MKIRRKGKFYVYIVECQNGTYYTGYTPDLVRRIKLHNAGKGAKYTRDRRPVKLVWRKEYKYFKLAFLEEKRIKRLTREQKIKLINGKRRIQSGGKILPQNCGVFSSPEFGVATCGCLRQQKELLVGGRRLDKVLAKAKSYERSKNK